MASVASFFGRFFGNTISESAAYGIGGAMQEPLRPLLQELANLTWEASAATGIGKPLGPLTAAEVVAEDVEAHDWGVTQSAQAGYTSEQFSAVLGAVLNAPGLGELFELWRRDKITDADFKHGLRKLKLEPRWDAALVAIKDLLLSPADLAMARQQGFVDEARQLADSALQGVPADNAQVLYELSGLPPGAETAQSYLNRGLIDDAMFAQIIREGHTKTKYTDVLRRGAAFVLSPINYVEGRLRGWLTDAEMYAGTALHGVTKDDTDLLFKIHGRPISFHQTFIGTRRGGKLDGPTAGIDPAFLASLRRSNIQPSFYDLAWSQRYTYPSAFVLRALTQAGDITQARAEEVLLFEGWEPGFAKQVSEAWAGGGGAKSDSHVGKAQTQLWGTLHRSYIAGESTKTAARPVLASLGLTTANQDAVFVLWDAERGLVRKQLTPAQIKKAYVKGIKNQATGATWTRDDALAALIERGYATSEANEFLDL